MPLPARADSTRSRGTQACTIAEIAKPSTSAHHTSQAIRKAFESPSPTFERTSAMTPLLADRAWACEIVCRWSSVAAMRVLELWRYPVKSLQGEQLDSVAVTADGLEGDRRFAIYDVETGFGLTARRVPELLFASARWRDDGMVEITLPDGSSASDDAALSAWIGRRV